MVKPWFVGLISLGTSIILAGCGASANISAVPQGNGTYHVAGQVSVNPSPTSARQASSTPSSSAAPSGTTTSQPGVTLSGTLATDGTARFAAWIGGTTSTGQFQWIPVTVQLDSGAQESQVSGALLNAHSIPHTAQYQNFTGVGGAVTGYWFPNLTLVPAANPRQPIFLNHGIYSGLGAIGTQMANVNLGEDILQQGSFRISGSHWTFTYQPPTVLPAPSSTSSTSPSPVTTATPQPSASPTPASTAASGPGYLGIEVTATPSDWSVQGCQVYTVLAGSPASTTPFIGQTQRTDPVGDVITQIADPTKGWGPIAVTSCQALQQDMAQTSPGNQVNLGYYHRVVFILGHWQAESTAVVLGQWPVGLQRNGILTF